MVSVGEDVGEGHVCWGLLVANFRDGRGSFSFVDEIIFDEMNLTL